MNELRPPTIAGYTLKDVDRRLMPYPENIDTLRDYCRSHFSVAENQFLSAGLYFGEHNKHNSIYPINGQYGVLLVLPRANEIVASAGFNIDDSTMIIRHTPQGHSPDFATRDQKRYFSSQTGRKFRSTMMSTIVNIGRNLGLKEIIGISAVNHSHTRSNDFPLNTAEKIIDTVLLDSGFTLNSDRNYALKLLK